MTRLDVRYRLLVPILCMAGAILTRAEDPPVLVSGPEEFFKPITEIRLGFLPQDGKPVPGDSARAWPPPAQRTGATPADESRVLSWTAAEYCHRPLHFDDVRLERYGHTVAPALQPLISGAHFFGTVSILPVQMLMHPPRMKVCPVGYYRSGSLVPCGQPVWGYGH